jgi:hypothetical protein
MNSSRSKASIAIACLGLVLALSLSPSARAQAGLRVIDAPPPEYVFGDQPPTFSLKAESDAIITEATLFVRSPDTPSTFVGKAKFEQGTTITATYSLDTGRRRIAAFSPVEFWWELRDRAGGQFTSDHQTFTFRDNRFEWQASSDGPITVHWYEGERSYAQAALDIARRALVEANRDLGAPQPEHVDIYLYATAGAVRAAITTADHLWIDSQANPVINVIIATVPPDAPDATAQMERKLPHELTHVLVYALVGDRMANLPTWLNEGLAMLNQFSPEPDFASLLASAQDSNSLLPLAVLCGPFPAAQAQARLAYAQSESVVRFIRDKMGSQKLHDLLRAYADDLDCSAGAQEALNLSLAELDDRWRTEAFMSPSGPGAGGDWWPWIVLGLLVVLAPFGFLLLARPQKAHTWMV